MNNNIKLTIWVYCLYRRPHAALKKNRNNPVMMVSILKDLTLHPCQIIMKKTKPSKLLKNKRENSKKDKEKHQQITWREKLNFNLNKKQSQMKILHKMMIHLNLKDHSFNIIRMVQDKEQKLHWLWLGYFWWYVKKNTFMNFLGFSYTLPYQYLSFHMFSIKIARKNNFTKPFIPLNKLPYRKISMVYFHRFLGQKMISWITHGFSSHTTVIC